MLVLRGVGGRADSRKEGNLEAAPMGPTAVVGAGPMQEGARQAVGMGEVQEGARK